MTGMRTVTSEAIIATSSGQVAGEYHWFVVFSSADVRELTVLSLRNLYKL